MPGTRRRFLAILGAAAAAQSPPRDTRIVRSARPEDLEMPMAGFLEAITPTELFFVRSHTYVPRVDVATWRLRVEGLVEKPLDLTLDELRRMPSVELPAVLECAGNGRAFYDPPVPGIQWQHGGVSNGRWRGVRLSDVLRRAGVKAGAVEVAFDGADVPLGTMPDFQRSVPIAKALHRDTLLAYEMNGAPLPLSHGAPLRAVVPGWAGDSWVKWITRIQVLDGELDTFWMKTAYRHPGRAVGPGSTVPANEMSPVTSLRVKSVIAAPNGQIEIGKPVTLRGAAWSGDGGAVSAVEVSVDNGRSWQAARLIDRATPYGWRRWEFVWTPQREQYVTLMARARDAGGDVQPAVAEWNPSGYLWNVVARANVTVGSGLSADRGPAPTPVSTRIDTACLGCHGTDIISQQRLTRAQWDREITKMTGWGAPLRREDRPALLDYLAANFGSR